MKIRTHYNYKYDPTTGEKNFEPSQTLPDQSLTVREILERYTSGLLPDIQQFGEYDIASDEDADDFLTNPIMGLGADELTDLDAVKTRLRDEKSKQVISPVEVTREVSAEEANADENADSKPITTSATQ